MIDIKRRGVSPFFCVLFLTIFNSLINYLEMRIRLILLLLSICSFQILNAQEKRNEITDHDELEKYNRESYGTLLPEGKWLNTERKDIFWQKDRMFLMVVLRQSNYSSDVFRFEAEKLKEANPSLETFYVYSALNEDDWSEEEFKHYCIKNQIDIPVYYTTGMMKSSPIDLSVPNMVLVNRNFSITKLCTSPGELEDFELGLADQMLKWGMINVLDISKTDTHDGTLLTDRPVGLINYPVAMASDARRKVMWIWNAGDRQLLEVSFDGKVRSVIGSGIKGYRDGSYGKASLGSTGKMVFDPNSACLYLVDHQAFSIRKVDTLTKEVSTILGIGEPATKRMPQEFNTREDNEALAGPMDIDLFDGKLYITMQGDNSIWSYDPKSGKAKREMGGGSSGYKDGKKKKAKLDSPYSIALDDSGNIYFSEADSGAVRYFNGKAVSTLETEYDLSNALSLAFESDSLSIIDERNNYIIAGDREELQLRFGKDEAGFVDKTGKNARFRYPMDMTEARGFYYLADCGNQVVRVIEPEIKVVQTLPIQESTTLKFTKNSTSGSGETIFLEEIHLSPGDNLLEMIMELPDGYSIPYDSETEVVMFDEDGDELITYDLSEGELLFNCIGDFKNVNLSFEISFEYIQNDNPLVKYYKNERVILPFTPAEKDEFTQSEHRVLFRPLKF